MNNSSQTLEGQQARLPPRVLVLGWVSFFADISSEMIYPLMPLFIVAVLGSPALTLGLIEGVAQTIVSLMTAYSGVVSDRNGKRVPFVRWGYGLPILGKAIITVASSWYMVLIGRSIDRFGKGLRGSPRDALIADAVSLEQRGRAFGFHRMMDTAGALVGVLIAASLLWLLSDTNTESIYRIAFGVAALLAFCSLGFTFFVDEGLATNSEATVRNKLRAQEPISASLNGLGREYWTTLVIIVVFSFANSSDAFLLLRASDVGLSALQVVLAYALYNFGYSALSYPAGALSDRFGRWKIVLIGWVIYAAVYAGFAISGSTFVWVLFTVYGLYMALTEGVSKALIVDCVPANKRGTALGVLYLAIGLSSLSSNVIAGYLWDSVSKSAPFWFGSFSALFAVIVLLISGKLRKEFAVKGMLSAAQK